MRAPGKQVSNGEIAPPTYQMPAAASSFVQRPIDRGAHKHLGVGVDVGDGEAAGPPTGRCVLAANM